MASFLLCLKTCTTCDWAVAFILTCDTHLHTVYGRSLFLWEEEGCREFCSIVVKLFLVHSVKDKSGSSRYHLLKRMKLDSVQLSVER